MKINDNLRKSMISSRVASRLRFRDSGSLSETYRFLYKMYTKSMISTPVASRLRFHDSGSLSETCNFFDKLHIKTTISYPMSSRLRFHDSGSLSETYHLPYNITIMISPSCLLEKQLFGVLRLSHTCYMLYIYIWIVS